ncbi:unnamed protein product [Arabis nemorensis]|uniref:Uncharacterized protein n=1 Tax=Arabis nemorensis TaxID=586526 RepID=A0A565C357_9BRAS|nr:unnamed protein product [Arabis nemorensis]
MKRLHLCPVKPRPLRDRKREPKQSEKPNRRTDLRREQTGDSNKNEGDKAKVKEPPRRDDPSSDGHQNCGSTSTNHYYRQMPSSLSPNTRRGPTQKRRNIKDLALSKNKRGP